MKRTNILVGVLSICLNVFGASARLSSNELTVPSKMTQSDKIVLSDPYHNLPQKDELYPCIEILAEKLGVDAYDLFALINFETGGKMNPAVASKTSSAKGLLQFTDGTAKRLVDKTGKKLKSSSHLVKEYSTIRSQLEIPTEQNPYGGPVYQYLNKLAPFRSTDDLYMAVMYPYSRKTLVLPKHISARNAGIRTSSDFIRMARKKAMAVGVSYD